LTRANADKTHLDEVEDLARYRELRWLDQNSWVPILSTAFGLFFAGIAIGRLAPWTGTNGPQLLIWAFFSQHGASVARDFRRELDLSSLGQKTPQHQ
jgi:hypothetical protein